MRKLLLIDVHALIHRFFHALPPLTTPDGRPIGAIYGLAVILLKIFNPSTSSGQVPPAGERPDYIAAAFDRPEPTFREAEYKEYKIHRPKADDALVQQIIEAPKIFELFGIPRFSQAGYEADDIIGSLAEKFKGESDLKITIVSGDLDVLQLVEDDKVLAQISKTGVSEVVLYNEAAVIERYGLKPNQLPDLKGLLGDTSDNIPGVKGVGPKTATPLIQEFGSVEEVFNSLAIISPKVVKKLEGHKDEAILSKKLGTIRRDLDLPVSSLDELATHSLNKEKLVEYFSKMGFRSLIDRVNSSTNNESSSN